MTKDATALRIQGVDKQGNPIYGEPVADPGFKTVAELARDEAEEAPKSKNKKDGK